MWEREIEEMKNAALLAEKKILEVYHSTFKVETKSDDSPVTEADKAADKIIKDYLKERFPDYAFLTEESVDTKERLHKDLLFIIDPVDGTVEFVNKSGGFSTNIALCYKNEIVKSKKDDEQIDESKYIFKLLNGVEWTTLKDVDAKKLQRAYFEAHSCARTTKGAVLLTIEQQVAMLRNTFIPCVWLMVIALCKMDFSCCAIFWIMLGYWFVCGIIIWAREYKLFAIVLSTYNLK